jgi:hypothetical protein
MQTVRFGNRVEHFPNQLSVTGHTQSERQLTLVIYFVGSKQIGVLLTENCFGTTPIANGPEWILLIGSCLRCVFSQIHRIWISSSGPEA